MQLTRCGSEAVMEQPSKAIAPCLWALRVGQGLFVYNWYGLKGNWMYKNAGRVHLLQGYR